MKGRTAVVVFNLGGPDSLKAVRPFLRNLFSDPAILRMWTPLRWILALLISWRRAPLARSYYERMGGSSPLLAETRKQASLLQSSLSSSGKACRVFIAMRYWRPSVDGVVRDVSEWNPERIVLLPLYPQFSTTTTGSFLRVWRAAGSAAGIRQPTAVVCCWFLARGFIDAVAAAARRSIDEMPDVLPYRVLFSAHGLPVRFVEDGDPYKDQVERCVAAVVDRLAIPGLDHAVCYQSRVGRLEWLRPYTEDEIRRAGTDGKALVVIPIAFVSENLETLVELDITYRELALKCGVPRFARVPAVGIDPVFIETLADMVVNADREGVFPGSGNCGQGFADCPCSDR